MTIEEFTAKTAVLEEFYDKKLNYTQKQIWYEELKNYSAEKYEKAIRFLCKNSQYRPTLSQMYETILTVKLDDGDIKKRVVCKACKGSGYLIYHKKINDFDYEYASLCNCENARGLEYDGSKIADVERRSSYYLEKAENIFTR